MSGAQNFITFELQRNSSMEKDQFARLFDIVTTPPPHAFQQIDKHKDTIAQAGKAVNCYLTGDEYDQEYASEIEEKRVIPAQEAVRRIREEFALPESY